MSAMTATRCARRDTRLVVNGTRALAKLKPRGRRRERHANNQALRERGAEFMPRSILVTGWDVA